MSARASAPISPSGVSRARIDGLDGLRAIAVVAVLLYHAEVGWASGGFVGVDIFFVLSGYLVTSIVLDGYGRTGGLGFRRFWAGRFRRLLPAQFVLFVWVTLAVALLHGDELADLRGQVLASLAGVTNWYLIVTEGSYFEQLGRPPMLRHLWSLAIELQFYLAFPPILVLAMRRAGERLDLLVAGLLVVVVASAVWMAVLFDPSGDPTRAYFDTFARLAAPLLGAVLALVWRPAALSRGPAAEVGRQVTLAGSVALVLLVGLLHAAGDRSAFMYRGGFLVAAVLSAVVVAAVVHPSGGLGSRRLLAHPALVAIGLRSYGLYLWHWPVFMLLRPRIDVTWSWGTTFVVRMALTVALTELCYRLVERPWHLRAPDASLAGIRRRLLQPSGIPTGMRVAALGSLLAVIVASVALAAARPGDDEIADSLREGEAALADAPEVTAASVLPVDVDATLDGVGSVTTTTVAAGPPTVTLVGDSVMLGAAPDLLGAFGDRANIDAKVGRQAEALGPVIAQIASEGRLQSTVVVQVGINGTVTEGDLRAIEDAVDGRRLLVVNARVPRPWEGSNNELVADVVPRLANAEVVDWFTASDGEGGWYLGDGVHLTQEGRAAYAALIARAVDAGS
jgi:peptidoglycan/LPS O-acetylase OafA/YrhL